jgi:Fe-S-cluster containining protein
MRGAKPYYRRQPLHFHCTGCGACCSGGGGYYVFVERAEAARICAYLGLGWAWFRRRYLGRTAQGARVLRLERDGRCTFLGADGACRVYAARPRQCASYPFWPEVVGSRAAWQREARRCEGIDRGEKIPLGRIERMLKRAEPGGRDD